MDTFPDVDVPFPVRMPALLAMVLGILHQSGFKDGAAGKLRNQVRLRVVVDDPAGLALEAILLDHPAPAITGFLLREDREEHHPAFRKRVQAFLHEDLPLLPAKEVQDVVAIDSVVPAIVKRHASTDPW